MRVTKYCLLLCCSIYLLLTCWLSPTQSAPPLSQIQKSGQGPMVIHSDTLEADDKKRTITFTGNVEAKREDFTVYCQNMVIYYEKSPAKKGSEEPSTQIEKIVASGNVKIVRAEGGVATGEKAVYFQKYEKVVLSGNPVVKQKGDSVEGDRITLFLKEDRSVVESSPDKRVKAVIFPREEKKQGQ